MSATVKCEFKTGFYNFGTPALNKKAKEQIADSIEQIVLDALDYIEFEMEGGETYNTQWSNDFEVTVE